MIQSWRQAVDQKKGFGRVYCRVQCLCSSRHCRYTTCSAVHDITAPVSNTAVAHANLANIQHGFTATRMNRKHMGAYMHTTWNYAPFKICFNDQNNIPLQMTQSDQNLPNNLFT